MIPGSAAQQLIDGIQALIDDNEQLRRQISAGSTSTAARTNKPKLSKRDVDMMRQLKRLGATNRELATAYDVNPATVSRTIRGMYH